ncbi:tRNA uridine-5-carboxymethylaminomethyl(34) synthesis GTPase MnmE [Novosphingobium sp. PC22D]|uniref:tRNA uridine-5-carboxymethylaminomethyl(34) synthesis GTPase MnmE n=1 Tax=Novosphingobium sp. PC22D TaxID=1962403 RepID=UPI000BF0DE59|nr:tRNA uridine-5-carboxymethylaminomethyl(34) synthesis GTPase MnmE [Novosphingobium sp. PC22D]PEQ12128.1 tRNA uridine-5-carboxymethylaminomethyl(34) synthesis GTPase MnmE [Novosphingobium sp. PC22D]
MTDTIYALSSGAPPAAIAVVRISGPRAAGALRKLAGETLPEPRRAGLRALVAHDGRALDRALVLWFPAPASATGEDLAELHLHGGRAVVAAVEKELAALPGLRRANPGEFTRRAFVKGRIDLAEAEGLADLLEAETELQRASALALSQGAFSRKVEDWRRRLLALAGAVEALLDFGDEDDVGEGGEPDWRGLEALALDLRDWLDGPRAETLREGFRVALAGPPNAGKSTLFNALVEDEAAITSARAGTTRDVIVRSVAISGVPFQFLDTAGLREAGGDEIEVIGMDRARAELARADLVLWLGEEGEGPEGAWEIEPQVDLASTVTKQVARHRVSAVTGEGVDALRQDLVATASAAMPRPGRVALNTRQRRLIGEALAALESARGCPDMLVLAEHLRLARVAFDALTGRASTEDMLDTLFARFCIGK